MKRPRHGGQELRALSDGHNPDGILEGELQHCGACPGGERSGRTRHGVYGCQAVGELKYVRRDVSVDGGQEKKAPSRGRHLHTLG